MARVLFVVPMEGERREVGTRKASGAFEPVVLDDLPAEKRGDGWATADIIVSMGFPREFPPDFREKARKVRMIQSLVAGGDDLRSERSPRTAIVGGTAGAYNISVAEPAMALLLAAAKDIPRRTDEIRRGMFDQGVMNKGLAGSTVVILGIGGIGAEIARRCKAFDMRVVGIERSRVSRGLDDAVGTLDDLPRYLPEADVVVLALPLTRTTEGLVDRRFLVQMKDDAILVNIARGKLIVEDDLFDHLKTHPKCRAALDTWWTYPDAKEGRPFHRPVQDLPNLVMTAHVADSVPGQRAPAMETALDNVLRVLRGEKPRNVIDPTEYRSVGSRDRRR